MEIGSYRIELNWDEQIEVLVSYLKMNIDVIENNEYI